MNPVVSTLTDGTGISAITTSKVLKDFVADFLLTAAAALGAGATFEAFDIAQAISTPDVVGIAIAGAFVKALFRVALRWAQS